ncbi:MAG TPA: NADH-quinone oxidoreductase subunit NuoE [candidate division Zixibacteria bacterium]
MDANLTKVEAIVDRYKVEDSDLTKVEAIVDRYKGEGGALIAILQDVQAEYNYLPPDALKGIAEKLGIPLILVYGIATFYKAFSLKPRGKHLVTVCTGTACHVRGAKRILAEVQKKLNVKRGETTEDKMFTLETVNCLGCCAIGPVMVVDGEYNGQTTTAKANSILEKYKSR